MKQKAQTGTLEADSHLFHQQNKVNVYGFGWEGWGSPPTSTSVAWQKFATLKEDLRGERLKSFCMLEKQEKKPFRLQSRAEMQAGVK